MTRTEAALARIRADHAAGRITTDERSALAREVAKAAAHHRNPFDVLDRHASARAP